MHSKIIQLSSNPISKDEYITEEDFYESLESIEPFGADYVANLDEYDDKEKDDLIFEILGYYSDICEINREKRTISLKKNPDWSEYQELFDKLKEDISNLSLQEFLKDSNCCRFRVKKLLKTIKDRGTCFYVDECFRSENGLIEELLYNGKYYIGGIVDYHF